jgi:toxin ParE1/3/4
LCSVIFSPESEDDLAEIFTNIALAGFPENAIRFVEAIRSFCLELKTFPNRGTARPDIAPGLRTIGFHRQVTILFEVREADRQVTIARTLHGGRSLEKALNA